MPVVIAIVVVFATILGTALVTISSAHQVGSGLDIQGSRAYYAARAGLEWGMYHVLRGAVGACGNIHNQSIDFSGNLSGFRATLACNESPDNPHNEGGVEVRMYAITSTACNATSCTSAPVPTPLGYVNRELRVTVSK